MDFRLDYDAEYGINRRSGYSVHINGVCLVQFERTLTTALWKAWRRWRKVPKDER